MQWFRMYGEFINDPKVQMLSEIDQRRYIMLLCIRCNEDVTLHDDIIVFQLRISSEEWKQTKQALINKNLIDKNNNITNWNKRQYISDTSNERVKKHRLNKKKQGCNVTVTPSDTDTDTDTENIIPLNPPRDKKGCKFDFEIHVTDEWYYEAKRISEEKGQRLSDKQIKFVMEQFADYWNGVSGAKANKKDWIATWRNWVRGIKYWQLPKDDETSFEELTTAKCADGTIVLYDRKGKHKLHCAVIDKDGKPTGEYKYE